MAEVFESRATHEMIAHMVRDRAEFRNAARKVYGQVQAAIAGHTKSGKLAAALSMEQAKVDWWISANPAEYDWHVEFGHYVYYDKLGNVVKRDSKWARRQWVDGIGVFRGVVARNGGF